ncbi:MAG: hypothetical protein JJE21_02210 [Spirochaetaceae bacterium]|nr:hypothetical protein [Spirochaetaceae bacterium]
MIKIGNPKKLDISLEKLISIALSINKNTVSNKSKTKEQKIPTDKFIKQFEINRKDFSFTIKYTEIKYNKSTFLYDLPEVLPSNIKVTNVDIISVKDDKQQSNNKVTPVEHLNQSPSANLKSLPVELRKIINQSAEIEEMLYWYRHHKDDDKIIEVPEININHTDLEGDLMVRSFKTYVKVLDKFAVFCKDKKELQKDLIALALVEFIDRYK